MGKRENGGKRGKGSRKTGKRTSRPEKYVFPFPRGKAENGPKKGEWGKRANEIECREKGKGKAPDLKSEARLGFLMLIGFLYAYNAICMVFSCN